MEKKNQILKKGVSPVIATVLLIAMVIIIGLIIFLWFRGFTQEAITKFEKNIQLVCDEVSFTSEYSSSEGKLYLINDGNVPIYDFKVKIFQTASHQTVDLSELDENWKISGLRQGGSFSSKDLSSDFSDYQKILLIPILAGISKNGEERTHVCDERHANEI